MKIKKTMQTICSTLSWILCYGVQGSIEEPSERVVHIETPNFYRSSDTITLEINDVPIPFKFDSICRSLPPIYQFRPKTEIGIDWKPFSSPALVPMSISWNPNFDSPDIFTKTQGPRISYKILIGAELFITGTNRDVVVHPYGGSFNQQQQTALIKMDEYRTDSILFHYNDGKLYPYYFSYCHKDDD